MFAPAGTYRSLAALVVAGGHLLAAATVFTPSREAGAQARVELIPGRQLPRLHVGNTIVGYGDGSTIFSYYHPNGTLYEAWQGYGVNAARYWFDGDALCVQYRNRRSPSCYFVVVQNNKPFYITTSTKEFVTTFSQVYQGDVEGLAGASRQQGSNRLLWALLGSAAAACMFFIDCFGGGADSYAGDPDPGTGTGYEDQRRKDQEDEWRRRHSVRRPYGGSQSPSLGDLYEEPNWGWVAPE